MIIPTQLKDIAVKAQPWSILALLLISILLLLLSAASTDSIRQRVPVISVQIGAAELEGLGVGASTATGGGSAEVGSDGSGGVFSMTMWGWCVGETCSVAKMLPDLSELQEMP